MSDVKVITGSFWETKQRQGNRLHRICPYQGSFPPQLVSYFLDKYPGEVVLDPFCGRGTVMLEAALRERVAYGIDALDTSVLLSSVKLDCPTHKEVIKEIEGLDLKKPAPPVPQEFVDLYDPKTWAELHTLRETKKSKVLTALALGRLHGHSSGFFSSKTFNVIALSPESLRKQREKHLNPLPYRNVKELLIRAANRFIPKDGIYGAGKIIKGDSRNMDIPDNSVDVVITSPPFFNVIDYPQVNWVREWFIKADTPGVDTFLIKTRLEYLQFLTDVLVEIKRVVKPGGVIVFEVGPTRKQENMADLVLEAAKGQLIVEQILINEFSSSYSGNSVPKISRAMHKGKETKTTANQCVILRKK